VAKILRMILLIVGGIVSYLSSLVLACNFPKSTTVHPIDSGRLGPGISTTLDMTTNVYSLESDQGLLVIDAGNSSTTISDGFVDLGFDPGALTDVLITHAQPDHLGAWRPSPGRRIKVH
jgi:glyoxylase-like metal-dependent hydrolase (beta-lactamase superfamily II)